MAVLKDSTVQGALDVEGILNGKGVGVYAYKSDGGAANTTAGNIAWNGIWSNRGILLSLNNSRFTVPEDGHYFVAFRNIGNAAGTTTVTYVRKNGANIVYGYGRAVEKNYPMVLCFAILDMVEGDYVECYKTTVAMYQSGVDYTQFMLFKIA